MDRTWLLGLVAACGLLASPVFSQGCSLGNSSVYEPEFEYTKDDGCTECVCGPGTVENTYDWDCSSDACASGCSLGNSTVYDPEFEYSAEDGCTVCQCGPGADVNSYDWVCSSDACDAGCLEDGKRYAEGDKVPRASPCERCTCTLTDGTYDIQCAVSSCVQPACENPVTDSNICCPFCPKTCTLENGTVLEEGESYKDDCNVCTCKDGEITCTEESCDDDDGDSVCNIALFRECFIEHVEVSLYTMVGEDRLAMCKARLSLERCVHRYLESCEDVNGGILTSILRPYAAVLGAISRLNCDTDFMDDNYGGQRDYVAIARATKCMVDYTKVAVYGSFISICRQGKVALRCVAEATYSCSDSNKNMFSMVTDTIVMTMKTVCSMESCNLGMAERCLAEGYAVNSAQLYREYGSPLSCGFITEALMCAAGHVVQCGMKFEELGKDWLDDLDDNKGDQNEDSYGDDDASRQDADGEMEKEDDESGMDSLFSERLILLVNQLVEDHKELMEIAERSRSGPYSDDDTNDDNDEKMPYIPESDSVRQKEDGVYDKQLPGSKSDSDTDSVDGMSRNNLDMGRELLHAHFDDLHRRIGSLVDKLEDSEPGKGEYLRDTFSGLYARVQHLKANMERDDDGFRVQMTIKRLQVIHDNLAELVQDVESSGAEEAADITDVRREIDNLKETVRAQAEAEMEKMQERLYHVRDSLEFLHGKLKGFCLDMGKEGMAESGRPEFRVFDILGTLIASPFSNSTQICRLVESVKMYVVEVRSGDEEMDVEDLDEFLHSAARSLAYIDMIISPVCGTKDEGGSMNGDGKEEEEEEKCVPPSEEEPVCDQAGLTQCIGLGALDQLVADIQQGGLEEDPTKPCATARDILICVFENTKDCEDGEEDFITIKLAERLKNQVMSLVPAAFNCDFSLPEVEECEPEKQCNPRDAAMECFTEMGEFADECRVVTEKWLPCIKTKMEVCKMSRDFTMVQTLLKISLDKYADKLTECVIDPDLLLDDVTRPEAECSVSFYSALVTSLPMHDNFNSALCKAMSASYECEATQKFPYIVERFANQHARFYEEFWKMNCVEDKAGEGEAGDVVIIPDFTGCDVNAAVVTMGHFMSLAYSSYGVLSQTDNYAEACSETPYIELESQLSAITANCKPGAVEVINGSLPFLKSYHAEYCPFKPERKPGTCSVEGARDCTGKFGMYMALVSPYEDICSHLKSGLDCVAGFSVECDEESKALIEGELRYIHSIVGNVECERPSWCETKETGEGVTDDQEGEQGSAQEPADGGEGDIPQGGDLPFCAAPSTCRVQWRDCVAEDRTCNDSTRCIENAVSDCPDFIKLVVRANVIEYQNSLKAGEPAEGAESCDLVAPSLAGLASDVFDSCYAGFIDADVGSADGFAGALTTFFKCIGAYVEIDLPAVEIERLKASVQIYKNFQMDFFPETENGERGEETEGTNEPTDGQDDTQAGDGNEQTVDNGQEGQAGADVDAGDGEGKDDNVDDESDTCGQLVNAKKHLRDIAKLILLMPIAPFSDKDYICTTGHTLYVTARDTIKGCKNNESKELNKLLSLTGMLIDNMAFCSKDPRPRVCNPQAASACVSRLSQSLVDNHGGFILKTCSDVISVESCVYSNTMGCDWATRGYIEHVAGTVLSVVHDVCEPKPEPKPDMSCTATGEDQMCDLSGAASCLVKLQTSLMCEQPDWKEVCPTIPFVKTCVERHLHGCRGQETAVFEKLSNELMSKVKGHCMEVKCDVCGAERCMANLDKKKEDADFCWYAMEAKKCVRSMTQSCRQIHAGEVWAKAEQLFNMVDEHCTKKVYTCLDDFKYTAFALLGYSGPSVLIGEIDIETESEGSSIDESVSTDSQSIDSTESGGTSGSGGAGKNAKSSQTSGSGGAGKNAKSSQASGSGGAGKNIKSSQTSGASKGTKKVKNSKTSDSSSGAKKAKGGSNSVDSKRGSKKVKSSIKSKSTDAKPEKSEEINEYCDVYYYEDEPWSFADDIDIGVLDIIKKWNNEDDGSSEESQDDDDVDSGTTGNDDVDGTTNDKDDTDVNDNDKDDNNDDENDQDDNDDNDRKRRRKQSATNERSGSSDRQRSRSSARGSKGGRPGKGSTSSGSNQGRPGGDSESSKGGEKGGSRPTGNNFGGSKRPNKCLRKRTVPLHPDLYRLCNRLHTSWSCLESHAFMMDDSIAEPVKTSLYMVMQTVKQKCNVAPLQCHSCVKADSEEDCNAQPIETCAFNKQTCQTIVRPGKGKGSISKGCKNPTACKERCAEGQTCEKCCVGPLCNKYFDPPVTSMPQDYCDVTGPTYCALDFAMSLIKGERMDCKRYYEALECINHTSEGCYPSEMSKVMTLITQHMKTSKSWARCQAEIRACNCGGFAVASLDRVYLNPYSSSSTRCNHFGSIYEMMKYSAWDRCMPADHNYVSSSLHLFWSTQSSVCLKLEEEKETKKFCPLPTSYSADIVNCPMDCKLDEDCKSEDGTKMCCNNGCGGKSCVDSVMEDPYTEEPRPGYCPVPGPEEVGICQVECQIDSECTNVAQKCCKNACGGGICTQPLEEEPEQPLECLDDAPVARCVDDPCNTNTCPNFKDAECRTNYCGGCHAMFYVDNEDVTSRCQEPVTVDPLCLLPKRVGVCKALFPSWYFDVSAGECLQFNYGGCDGNENRFDTLEDCQAKCGNEIPTCYQPMEVGFCKAMLPSWYFDGRSGTCKEFYYGGCGGNNNRFTTKAQCQGQCANVTQLESDCEMVREQVIKTLTDHFVPLLKLLDGNVDLQCRLMQNEYKVKVSGLFKLCALDNKLTEITVEAEQMLAFDWTMCDDEMTDDEASDKKDVDEEKKMCKTFAEVQGSCSLPEITNDYDCSELAGYIACVQPLTEACNIFQLKQFHQILSDHIVKLNDKSIECDVDIPDMSDNAFSPVAKCAMSFVSLSRDVLINKFIPYGRVSEMCRAAEIFQACVYRIPSLPGKSHVSRMLDVADKVQKSFCSETAKPLTERQLCYQCEDAESSLACNEQPLEICPINKLSCMSRVNLKAEGYTITKGCANPAEVANSDKWVITPDGVSYQYICSGAFCNGGDPMKVKKDDEEEGEGEKDAILYSSCFDAYTQDQNAANGSYSLVNTAGEVYMAYCEFYPGHTYTYIAPTYVSSLNIDTLYNNKKEVMIRHQLKDGTQKESRIGQIESYSEWDISVQYRSYERYQKLENTDMGPFVYVGLIPVDIGKEHKGDTQGYSVNGKDYTFENCDGNANSYFVLLFNENDKPFTGYSVDSQLLMTKWIDDAFTVPDVRQLPDEYFSLFEMHMGGCGGFLTTGNTPTVKGATIGLRYDFVQPAPNCLYKEIEENVYDMLYKATVFPFLHEVDKGSFCSGVKLDAFSSVSESCSEDISGRITRVLGSFDSINLELCEQPLLSDEGDDEGDDEGTACDWKKCLGPIIPYFRSVSFPDECVHVTKGFECLDDLLPTCDQKDRVSIATGVLSVLQLIKGPLYCDIDLNEKICSASKIDPKTVCDFDAANTCLTTYEGFGIETPSELCLLAKNSFACVTYYLDNCKNKTNDIGGLLLSAISNNCNDDSISATFQAAPCDAYDPLPCKALDGVDNYFTNVTPLFDNSTDETCVEASEIAEGDINGCPSPLAAVADVAISVALEEIHTCDYSSLADYPDTTWSTCVTSFIDTTITAFTNGESYCTGMKTFSACLESADMYTLESHLMGNMLVWLEETIKANCSDFDETKEEVVETEGCSPVRAAHCQLSYGLLYAFSPLMPDTEKTGICKTEYMDLINTHCNTFSSGCDKTSLSMARLGQLTYSFNTLSNRLTICTEPEEPIWPEPESKCLPDEAMNLVSQLGLSLSECDRSNKLRDRVCWSVEIIKVAVHSRIIGCPDVVQSQVGVAWQEMSMLADAVCGREKELYEDTPSCIEYAYMPKTETCRADKALTCLINLEKEVFAVETTETRFCTSLRHAVKCNLDYTSGCDQQFKKVLTPLTEKVLKKFEGRCESTWCPVTLEPTKCDMETAISCMHKLRTSIEKGEDKICQLAEETRVCLKKAAIDCDLDRELKISRMLMSAQVISSTSCARLDDKDVDVSGCLEKYAMRAQALLNYGYNTDFDDKLTDKEDTNSEDVDGDNDNPKDTENDDDAEANDDANAIDDENDGTDADNEIDEKDGDDIEKDGDDIEKDGDDVEKDGDDDEKDGDDVEKDDVNGKDAEPDEISVGAEKKRESSGSGNNKNMKGEKGNSRSRGSWVNEDSRKFEDNVVDMCREAEEAWMCVEGSLQVLDPKTKSILSLLLNGIKMAVEEKCRPRHCHSCVSLDNNDDCNAQPTCACPAKQSMCYTSYEDGVYTKGCTAKCEECEGKEDCYCCEGHKCNNVGKIEPEEQCDVSKAMTCAFELVTVSITTTEMSYSIIQSKLECVMEYTVGCTSYNYRHLYTVCLTIVDLFRVGECVTQYGDPVCGTSAILSLGYLMRNKYSDKMSLCSQFEVTTDVVNNVMYDEICKEDDFLPIEESVAIAGTQLNGYCTGPADTDDMCDIKMAISECLESKSWRSPSDASECSDEMFTAFKTCCISYTKGCNAFQRSGIYLQVQRHLEQAQQNCNQDFVITTNLDGLRADIFLVDSYTQLVNFYSEFVLNVQTSMIGSLNFNEEICSYLSYLRGNVTELELPTLLDLFSSADNMAIFDELDEICKDPTIDEDTVVEECNQLEMDIVLVLDGSLSVKPEGFEKMREFIINLAQLADMESGAIRFGAVQFAKELYDEFFLNSFLEEVDGKMVQNKEKVLEYFENMIYQNKLRTNTGGAIARARDEFFSEARGARPGVQKHMLVITDGKSNEGPDSVEEAIVSRRANIHLFAVGVRMNRADAFEEMYAIASEPSSLNYLNIDEFDKLLESLTKIFIWFCRVDTPSECEYTKIVYELSDTMMLSFSSSYAEFRDKSEICSLVSAVSTSVESLSGTCAPYQNKAIRIVQAIIRVLTWKSCLTVSEEPQGSCDLVKVSHCISDSTQFLRAAAMDDDTVCSVVANLMSCLNYYGASCEDKTFIIKEMSFYATLITSRCPDMVAPLQCWGILSDDTEEDKGDENEAQTCDLVAIATGCLSETADLSISDYILDPCTGLMGLVNEVMKCARDEFVEASCDKTKFGQLMDSIVNDNQHFKDIYDAAMTLEDCPMPEMVELPDGYGVVEPPECAVVGFCDVYRVKECIEDLPDLDSNDCQSVGAVKACLVYLAGCTSIEYKVFMSSLRMTLMADFDAECLDSQGIEWTRPDGYSDSFVACVDKLVNGIMDSGSSTCDIFSTYLECLDNINDILVGPGLFARQYQVLSTVLESYCSAEPVEDDEISEGCSVTQSDLMCIATYTEMSASGLALSTYGKTELCAKHYGRLECAENIGSACEKGTPAGRLWEVYQLAEIMVYSGEICVDVPQICSVQTAMACISLLGQSVSRHDYLSGENDAVCSQLMYARKCLKITLNSCDLETQNAVISTFEEVECLALDICTTGRYEPEDPRGQPAKCIDRTVVTADYECSPYKAMDYIREMGGMSVNPFLPAQRRVAASCLAFSVGMQGVYNHIYNCGPIVTGLIDGLARPAIVAARARGCQTEIKTPCKEVEDCGVIKAKACIQEFRSSLDIYRTEGAQRICLEQESVRRCLDANIETCSDRVRVEIESEYQSILTDTVCVDNFDSCVTQYIHYLYKILDWKAYIMPEEISSETEEVPSEKSSASVKSPKSSSGKTTKSASGKSPKSASVKTPKTASGKTTKSASEKSAKSASGKKEKSGSVDRERRSASKKSKSKDSKSASKDSKAASKNSKTASKNSKAASKNSKTASKNSKTASNKASEKSVQEVDYTLRLIELEEYCVQFNKAWGCIGENWESVGTSFRGFVQVVFGTYHATAMSICNGPRPGYCKARNGMLDERLCETDGDCGAGFQKCCGIGLVGTICVDPEPVPEGCYTSFLAATRSSVKLIQSLYQNDDNGLMFCSLYTEISEYIYSTLTIEVCPNEFVGIFGSILTASKEVNTLLCIVPPEPPRPCVIDDVDACLAVYTKASETVQLKQKCSLFGTLELCAEATLKQCDAENADDKLIIDSITAKVAEVKNFLVCSIMPEFEFGVIGNIVVEEGDVPGKDVPLVLKQNPAELITGQDCSMRFNFDLIEDDMPKCGNKRPIKQLLIGNLCDMTFTKDNWDIPQNVSLTARIDGKRDGTRKATFRMIATLVCDGTDIQNAPIKDYVVSILDSDRKSVCQSVNDPHLTTFDGYKFDNHISGEFVLYKHTQYPFEVRVFYYPCFTSDSKEAKCNCGVMVICGDDTFTIFKCKGRKFPEVGKPTMWQNDELMEGFRVFKLKKGKKFKVRFPTGTEVDINMSKRKKARTTKVDFISVAIKPSAVDWGRTQGLCGTYDNDQSNDLLCPDGTLYDLNNVPKPKRAKGKPQPNDFNKCWQVAKEDYSFQGVPANPSLPALTSYCLRSEDNPDETCTCNQDNLVEQCSDLSDKEITTTMQQGASLLGRRKRAIGDITEGIEGFDPTVVPPEKDFPTPTGITEEQATTVCVNEITQADFFEACQDQFEAGEVDTKIEDCKTDILEEDNIASPFVAAGREALREKCVSVAGGSTNATLVDNIIDTNSCDNGCSGQGTCLNGTCICNDGFVDTDCSLNINDPPLVDQLASAICTSVQQGDCAAATVEGTDFVDSAFCHYETVEMTETGIIKSGNQTSKPAIFDSFEEVSCDLSSTGSLPLHAVLVSVSNNNGTRTSQSDQLLFIAYDPICWSCSIDTENQTGTCQRERASCLEDGVCYRPTDPKVGSPCFLCDAFTGTMVYYVSENCSAPTTTAEPGQASSRAREMDDAAVIGLSAGIAVLVLVVIGVVAAVLIIRRRGSRSESSSLTRKSRGSTTSSDDNDRFREVVYPAYPNYGYYGYGQDMFIEAPAEMFAGHIPKRQDTRQSSSRQSDPTHRPEDYYDNRRSGQHGRRERIELNS